MARCVETCLGAARLAQEKFAFFNNIVEASKANAENHTGAIVTIQVGDTVELTPTSANGSGSTFLQVDSAAPTVPNENVTLYNVLSLCGRELPPLNGPDSPNSVLIEVASTKTKAGRLSNKITVIFVLPSGERIRSESIPVYNPPDAASESFEDFVKRAHFDWNLRRKGCQQDSSSSDSDSDLDSAGLSLKEKVALALKKKKLQAELDAKAGKGKNFLAPKEDNGTETRSKSNLDSDKRNSLSFGELMLIVMLVLIGGAVILGAAEYIMEEESSDNDNNIKTATESESNFYDAETAAEPQLTKEDDRNLDPEAELIKENDEKED